MAPTRQVRRAEIRDVAKLVARSTTIVTVCLNKHSKRFEVYGNVIETDPAKPEECMARDLLERIMTSRDVMNAELDRFAGCAQRAKARALTTGRTFEETYKEELEKSDSAEKEKQS